MLCLVELFNDDGKMVGEQSNMAVVVTGGDEHDGLMLMIIIIDSVRTHTESIFRYIMWFWYWGLCYNAMLYTSKSTRTAMFFVLHFVLSSSFYRLLIFLWNIICERKIIIILNYDQQEGLSWN